jgi:hypothetical protein
MSCMLALVATPTPVSCTSIVYHSAASSCAAAKLCVCVCVCTCVHVRVCVYASRCACG